MKWYRNDGSLPAADRILGKIDGMAFAVGAARKFTLSEVNVIVMR